MCFVVTLGNIFNIRLRDLDDAVSVTLLKDGTYEV